MTFTIAFSFLVLGWHDGDLVMAVFGGGALWGYVCGRLAV